MAFTRLTRAVFYVALLLVHVALAVPSNPPLNPIPRHASVEAREDVPLLTPIDARGKVQKRQTCNTATNRQCWDSTFNINTDYETSWPNTGQTKTASNFSAVKSSANHIPVYSDAYRGQ